MVLGRGVANVVFELGSFGGGMAVARLGSDGGRGFSQVEVEGETAGGAVVGEFWPNGVGADFLCYFLKFSSLCCTLRLYSCDCSICWNGSSGNFTPSNGRFFPILLRCSAVGKIYRSGLGFGL